MKIFEFDTPVNKSLDGKEYWLSHFEVSEDNIPWGINPVKVRIRIYTKDDGVSVEIASVKTGHIISHYLQSGKKWKGFYEVNPWEINLFDTEDEAKEFYNSLIQDEIDDYKDKIDNLKNKFL